MEEREFNELADAMLNCIETALEASAGEFDFDMKPGGVLELSFDNGSKIIVNRHSAAREIWVAARSGGYHFRPSAGRWVDTRSAEELLSALARLMNEQAGISLSLDSV